MTNVTSHTGTNAAMVFTASGLDSLPAAGRRHASIAIPGRIAPRTSGTMIIGAALAVCATGGTWTTPHAVASPGMLPPAPAPALALSDRRRRVLSAPDALIEVQRLTSLAWGTLADCLKVSRRTLHSWLSGDKPTTPVREIEIAALHERAEALHAIDAASAGAAVADFYGVKARISKGYARRHAEKPEAILEAIHDPLSIPLEVRRTRPRHPPKL